MPPLPYSAVPRPGISLNFQNLLPAQEFNILHVLRTYGAKKRSVGIINLSVMLT